MTSTAVPSRLAWLQGFTRRPLFPMMALVLVSMLVKECYPLSAFPMYADPANGADYLFLEDEKGDPIALKTHFSISGSKLKKSYYSHLNEVGREQGIEDAWTLGDEARIEAGRRLLDDLRRRGASEEDWTESGIRTLRLQRVHVHAERGGIIEDKKLILQEPAFPGSTVSP